MTPGLELLGSGDGWKGFAECLALLMREVVNEFASGRRDLHTELRQTWLISLVMHYGEP